MTGPERKYEAKIREYRRRAEAAPLDMRIAAKLADYQLLVGDDDAAVATYERIARQFDAQGFTARAIYAYDEACKLVRKARPSLVAKSTGIFCRLAELHLERDDEPRAVQTLEELAAVCRHAGLERAEVAARRQIVALAPSNEHAREELRVTETRTGDVDTHDSDVRVSVRIEAVDALALGLDLMHRESTRLALHARAERAVGTRTTYD